MGTGTVAADAGAEVVDEGAAPRASDMRVAVVREFGRFWSTDMVARLDGGLSGSPYSPAEARVIFELGTGGPAELARLRPATGLDTGHLARIVNRLRYEGVVAAAPAVGDGGCLVELTVAGRERLAELDRQVARQARSILAGLREDRQRDVVAAMTTIRRALSGEVEEPFRLRPPGPGDLGWVIQRHGCVYAEEYGWDERFEGEIAGLLAGFTAGRDPARERGWIVEVDDAPAGCVFCFHEPAADSAPGDTTGTWMAGGVAGRGSPEPGLPEPVLPETALPEPGLARDDARMRMLLVDPAVRGLGLGRRLVGECVAFAGRAGYGRLLLRTEDAFTSSHRIVEAAGFELVDERAQHRYGRPQLIQDWALPLPPRGIT